MTGVDTIVTKADIMEEEIAITEIAEGQLTTIIPIILLVDIVVVALLHIHVVVALLLGEGKYISFFLVINEFFFILMILDSLQTNITVRVYLRIIMLKLNRAN